MILKMKDIIENGYKDELQEIDSIFVELEKSIGKRIMISLTLVPDETEVPRILKDVSFIRTYWGWSILLDMEEDGEKVELLVQDIIEAKYSDDVIYSEIDMMKFHLKKSNIQLISWFETMGSENPIPQDNEISFRIHIEK